MEEQHKVSAEQRHKNYTETYFEFKDKSQEKLEMLTVQFRDTMRNLALAMGAMAAAGIASLNLPIQKIDLLVIHGSLLLFVLSVLAFCHLLISHRTEVRSVVKFRNETLKPLEEILNAYDAMVGGAITEKDYLSKEFDFAVKEVANKKPRDLSKENTNDDIELWTIVGLGVSLCLIVIGYAGPIVSSSVAGLF